MHVLRRGVALCHESAVAKRAVGVIIVADAHRKEAKFCVPSVFRRLPRTNIVNIGSTVIYEVVWRLAELDGLDNRIAVGGS